MGPGHVLVSPRTRMGLAQPLWLGNLDFSGFGDTSHSLQSTTILCLPPTSLIAAGPGSTVHGGSFLVALGLGLWLSHVIIQTL